MHLKDNNNPFIHVNPPYQLMVIHSSKLVYPRELYQRGVERKRVELIAANFNEYVANEPKVNFRNGQFIVPFTKRLDIRKEAICQANVHTARVRFATAAMVAGNYV